MQRIIFKSNNQCSINIPKELIEATDWEEGDLILISKIPGQKRLVIENISQGKKQKRGEENR